MDRLNKRKEELGWDFSDQALLFAVNLSCFSYKHTKNHTAALI